MSQAATVPNTASSLAHLFRFLWSARAAAAEPVRAASAPAAALRPQVAMLRRRAEILLGRADAQHPAVTQRQVARLLAAPIAALLREHAGRLPARVGKLLADSLWELEAVDSIGDTLHPDRDRDLCVGCARDALEETVCFLVSASRVLAQ